ncbi:MAG: hypothetical protein IJ017_01710 [Oscillospiraceae bacterium]|nr:hypothetical protein [Oscillospiraceae bacterium]
MGKSTALRKFLVKSGLTADGVRTYWRDADTLLIEPFEGGKSMVAAVTDTDHRKAKPEAFEYGADVIEQSGKKDVIVLDELGRLERCSERFMNAVFEKLSGEKRVLGVIKPESNHFLDKIREMPNIVIIEVTEENRDSIPAKIAELMR